MYAVIEASSDITSMLYLIRGSADQQVNHELICLSQGDPLGYTFFMEG